jgi:hypothetical protein
MSYSDEHLDQLLQASGERWRAAEPPFERFSVAALVRQRGTRRWLNLSLGLAASVAVVVVATVVLATLFVFGPLGPASQPGPTPAVSLITEARAIQLARETVPADAVEVSAVSGRYNDVKPDLLFQPDAGDVNRMVWVVSFDLTVEICPPPVPPPPTSPPCWSQPGIRSVVLDGATGEVISQSFSGPPASASQQPEPTTAPPTPPPTLAWVVDQSSGISFERPSNWARWQPNHHNPINDGPLIYLSSEPLLPDCAVAPSATPNPPDAQGRACDWPLASLAPNGVLITWLTTRILQPLPTAGEVVDVNATTAHLQVDKPGGCVAVGADETLELLVPIGQPTPESNIAMVACLRGPDLATSEAQVRAMLASARVSP